ncbi:ThiF family adenylyltransferase, partial [Streptomyces sp. DSM 44917]
HTVRYGVTPAHAVLFGPVDTATESFLGLLDGTRALPALRRAATALGLADGAADRLTEQLAAAGVLDDATAEREAACRVTDGLRPDLATLSLLHPEPGEGLRRLLARGRTRVQVRGAGRVGVAVAAALVEHHAALEGEGRLLVARGEVDADEAGVLQGPALAQAGVGEVEVVDGGRVEPEDLLPAGLRPQDAGQRRSDAARRVVRAAGAWRARPPAAAGASREGTRLVVLAPRDGLTAYAPDPAAAEELMEAGTPHLYAGVVEATGFVGPLVLPGVTGCADCMLRERAAREPAWPLLVGQWRNARRAGVPACDGALATAVAGLTACAALSFLDGSAPPGPAVRTEVALPGPATSCREIQPHPECACQAALSTRPPPARSTMNG